MTQASAREVALRVFLEWDEGRESADALLDGAFRAHRLSPRDRALAFELVRGVFRWRGRLDWQLAAVVTRPFAELEPIVRWLLRLGLYQLEHLDRVPAHAAVDTSVELAKRFRKPGAATLVNAVLRRAPAVVAELAEPDASTDPVGHLAARTSHPAWLLERWCQRFGFRKTKALAAANNEKPSLTLRVTSDRVEPADLIEDLRAEGVEASLGRYVPESVRLPGGWHPALEPILDSGIAVVQDEAASLVTYAARPVPGARVLDVCAAPGGKSLHFAQLCGGAFVVACDVSAGRLAALDRMRRTLCLDSVHPVVADGRRPATAGGFSRVLVDAPCTNTGVLGKRSDARWRKEEADVARLAALQLELLDASRAQVAPGGLLVYSTCSLEPEENEGVVGTYLSRHPSDRLQSVADVLPDELVVDSCLATNPVSHGIDGAFAAVIRPNAGAFEVLR